MSTAQVRPADRKTPARDLTAGKSNTEIEVSRGNTRISRYLLNQDMPYLIDRVTWLLGPYDLSGELHPGNNVTEFNWSEKGLHLTAFYRGDLSGRANVLAVCTDSETWRRFQGVLS